MSLSAGMPWIDEEIEAWEHLSDAEREEIRALLRDLGADFPDEREPDYFE